MSDILKLEIFVENKDFDLLFNDFRNKHFSYRENRINNILGLEEEGIKSSVYGEFESDYIRNTVSIRNVSHLVVYLSKENSKYYAHIKLLDTKLGKIANDLVSLGGQMVSYPVFTSDKKAIITFDVYVFIKKDT